MECDFFRPIILRSAEYHIQCDFSRTSCLPTGDDSSEGRAALLNAAFVNFHLVEGFLVDEVQPASAVHEHFSEPEAVHNWTKDQGGWCPDCSELRFVTGIEGYGRVAPWIYCCHVANFGETAMSSLVPII